MATVMSTELGPIAEFLTGNPGNVNLPWRALRGEDLRVIRSWVRETAQPAIQRRTLRALRQAICQEAARRDDASGWDDLGTQPRATRGLQIGPARLPSRTLSKRQARLLLDVCEDAEGITARRDAAVLALMLLAGLRRQEIVAAQRNDLDEGERTLQVFMNKRPARLIVLEGRALKLLQGWLAIRGTSPGPLFLATSARGEILPAGISSWTVSRLVARRCREAGISGVTSNHIRDWFLWQLRAGTRTQGLPGCRFFQTEAGQAAWALHSLADP